MLDPSLNLSENSLVELNILIICINLLFHIYPALPHESIERKIVIVSPVRFRAI